MMQKWIYSFSPEESEGDVSMLDLLGSKGAYLADMCNLGMPIPPGFTITTEFCHYYIKHNSLPDGFLQQLEAAMEKLNKKTGKIFGSAINPLLTSVRSGAKISMPGMMDTILNIGLNYNIAQISSKNTLYHQVMWDSYSRLIESYGATIFQIDAKKFHNSIKNLEDQITFKIKVLSDHDCEMPEDTYEQLIKAILAVVKSWNSPRAIAYRKLQNISQDLGTAITVQAMVFGNYNDNSGTGVVFSRNPATGVDEIYGEFLNQAQGEDIVAGVKTPRAIDDYMKHKLPVVYSQLVSICKYLEKYYNDVQDIEFTVENSELFILQTRSAKRTAAASVKIAVDMCHEGMISKEQALLMINPSDLKHLMHANILYIGDEIIITNGMAASPGGAVGKIILSPEKAIALSKTEKVILVRQDTSPEDIEAMYLAEGFLTINGGLTSHAAVIARGLGKPCVCGANFSINEENNSIIIGDQIFKEGDLITIDGSSGKVCKGALCVIPPEMSAEFYQIIQWALSYNKLKVRANAETIIDINNAIKFGAIGIGLCRSEHMFFDSNKIRLLQEVIIINNHDNDKAVLLEKLKLLHQKDYEEIFLAVKGWDINIRLLDPPLHEFLPQTSAQIAELSEVLNISEGQLASEVKILHEINPMLGKRGCRLGLIHPEIYIMQIEAIFGAWNAIFSKYNIETKLEIMLPLISDVEELKILREMVIKIANNFNVHNYKIGAMIELPRAALLADSLTPFADYFSFGTNDLTQTMYGLSRDDSSKFLPEYLDKKLYKFDPFVHLDVLGVGAIMKIAIEKARGVKPDISFSICGEQGCHETGINFAIENNINYVSCSPYNIPIAILAIAQNQIRK